MKTVTEVLVEARDLISAPERWTQGFYARNSLGHITEWDSPSAVCWCAEGAVGKAAGAVTDPKQGTKNRDIFARARDELKRAARCDSVPKFNDTHAHAEVLAAFGKAIAESKS